MPYGIAKGDVDFLLACVIWQRFANWHAKPYPSIVGQKPNGKIKWGRANVGNAVGFLWPVDNRLLYHRIDEIRKDT